MVEDRFPYSHLGAQTHGTSLCMHLLMAVHNLVGVSMWNLMATSLCIRDELLSASLTARPWLPTWRTT